ncbi:MAG: Gfo/Idh/MocA family oxidoreductase [Verrucomicrobia bacterium]|jgi:predicted dehydrogenase|nr:Gfo/Idh/MocA family oxidoreductase [Verrucomicrobiota bacterium]
MKKTKSRSSNRKVNVAVVGLGFMGVTHIKAYQQIPGARLVAVCDAVRLPVNGVLGGAGGNIGDQNAVNLGRNLRTYRKFEELLADLDVELIDLCVPTSLHAPQAIAALRAGKHVICEKPLARNPAIAREIVKAAKAAKGFFMPAMCMRFWPGWAWLKELATKKTYGKILAARFRRVSAPPGWSRSTYFKGSDSGGALLDLHIHDTDFVQFLFGRPKSVFSTGLSRFTGAVDHVVTQYQVTGGATVHAEGSWLLMQGFNMGYTVMFERATADFDLARGADALRLDERGKPSRVVKLKGPDGYSGELRHMIQAIETGKAPTVVTAQDGLSAVEICAAEEKSVKTGRVVAL